MSKHADSKPPVVIDHRDHVEHTQAIHTDYCKERVWCEYEHRQCTNRPKRDGYCGLHHPDAVAARAKARCQQPLPTKEITNP